MPDEWMDHDFNGGEWWQQWPPPPGANDDYYDSFTTDNDNVPDKPLPITPEFPDRDVMLPGQLTGDQANAFDYFVDFDRVDPSQIRGIAFESYQEAFEWLQNIGLLGFSSVTQTGGFYYPVVGESDELEVQGDDPELDTNWEFEGIDY